MDKIFSESNIVNKEYYEGIKSMINCLICLNIIENPVQCTKCQHYFCSECINSVNKKCPLRCENNEYIKSMPCLNLLSNLKFKCKCDEIVTYDQREKHIENCKKKDFEVCYLYYKDKCNKLQEELNFQNKLISNFFIKTSVHKHPMEIIRRYKHVWFCNMCKNYSNDNIPSYHCTLCDYDLCINCADLYLKEGKVKHD